MQDRRDEELLQQYEIYKDQHGGKASKSQFSASMGLNPSTVRSALTRAERNRAAESN